MLDMCNSGNMAAKTLQRKHSQLHLANLIRQCGPISGKGTVISVQLASFDVILIGLEVTRRIYLDVSC